MKRASLKIKDANRKYLPVKKTYALMKILAGEKRRFVNRKYLPVKKVGSLIENRHRVKKKGTLVENRHQVKKSAANRKREKRENLPNFFLN